MTEIQFDPKSSGAATARLAQIIALEGEIRAADNIDTLRFVIVNRLRDLIPYHQACLLRFVSGKRYQIEAISNIAVIQRDAPFVGWIQELVKHVQTTIDTDTPTIIDMAALPQSLSHQAQDLSCARLICCPLRDSQHRLLGMLVLGRGLEWSENDAVLLGPILDCFTHAWGAFVGHRRVPPHLMRHTLVWGFLLTLAILMFLPVSQSSLAPSQVIAHKPAVVAAPLEGVIKRVLVEPNQSIQPGTRLFVYEDTLFRNRFEIAKREVSLAKVELEQATQGSFVEARSNADRAVKAARLDKERANLAFAEEEFQKINVTADQAGIAVFNSPDDWIGRPVSLGERVMMIADPVQVAIDALLPIRDAVETRPGARVQIFLDNSPLKPLEGTVVRTSFDAQPTPEGVMAFRVRVRLNDGERLPRIGAHGVSKIYSESVSLFFFLFRRPLTVLRQTIGF